MRCRSPSTLNAFHPTEALLCQVLEECKEEEEISREIRISINLIKKWSMTCADNDRRLISPDDCN